MPIPSKEGFEVLTYKQNFIFGSNIELPDESIHFDTNMEQSIEMSIYVRDDIATKIKEKVNNLSEYLRYVELIGEDIPDNSLQPIVTYTVMDDLFMFWSKKPLKLHELFGKKPAAITFKIVKLKKHLLLIHGRYKDQCFFKPMHLN